MQTPLMQNLRWMRLFGDTIFAIGAVAFVWFALGLILKREKKEILEVEPVPAAA